MRASQLICPLVHEAPEVVMLLGDGSTVRYANPSIHRILGHRPENIVGTRLLGYLPNEEQERVSRELGGGREGAHEICAPIEFRMRHADGSWRHLEAVTADLTDDPVVNGRVCYVRHISQRKALHENVFRRAFRDPLTGLANRALFMDRLMQARAGASREPQPVAMLFIDLDDFKAINDGFGHETGDRLLIMVGRCLRACLGPADTAARLGEDEFGVLLQGDGASSAPGVAERILESLRAPTNVGGHTLVVTASVGVGVSHPDQHGARELLRAADAAMYRAKTGGKSNYVTFQEDGSAASTFWDPARRTRHRPTGADARVSRLDEGEPR